ALGSETFIDSIAKQITSSVASLIFVNEIIAGDRCMVKDESLCPCECGIRNSCLGGRSRRAEESLTKTSAAEAEQSIGIGDQTSDAYSAGNVQLSGPLIQRIEIV